MPSWNTFNSLVTDEDLTQKITGFLPILPYPVTEYAVVYTALKNFQDFLSQLDQSHLPITCDEGVYHITRAIIMNNPTEFSNLVLCLGSFNLIKVVMEAIGINIDGSGAEIILAESKAFGKNVVRSVFDGTHHTRSLKGLMLLSECFERLQWADIQELLTYDLIDTSYLFDTEGLMVKPNKIDLCSELEKMLETNRLPAAISMDTCQYHCNCRCHGSLTSYAIG